MLILYNFTQTQKYFTLALLVLLVTNVMSVEHSLSTTFISETLGRANVHLTVWKQGSMLHRYACNMISSFCWAFKPQMRLILMCVLNFVLGDTDRDFVFFVQPVPILPPCQRRIQVWIGLNCYIVIIWSWKCSICWRIALLCSCKRSACKLRREIFRKERERAALLTGRSFNSVSRIDSCARLDTPAQSLTKKWQKIL